MLAIKDLNNITPFEKPVPVILNRTAGLGYLCNKGDNPIFGSQQLPNFYDCHIWRLIILSQAGLKLTTLVVLNLKKVSSQIKAAFKENLNQIESKKFKASDSNMISKPFQRVKLGFEYDHVAPVALALRRTRGYRQLCSLWFEYDLCLNRKPPNDLERFLTTLI